MAEAIRVEKLVKSFGDLPVLTGIDMSVQVGETVVVLGTSGSGKSTLLRCMNFLTLPNSGRIYLHGKLIGTPIGDQANAKMKYAEPELQKVRARIGMVFQHFNLFPHMSVLHNIMEGQVTVLRRSKVQAEARARELLAKVGLADKADSYPANLSGGQQQRTAIARALAMDPEVMLFDEVTSALDPELVGEVLRVIRALREEGMTMVIVTHELGFAYHAADRVVFLKAGGVYEEGHPHDILIAPKRESTRQFLEGHNQFRLPEAGSTVESRERK
jgi:polar amino acid transport system ATP-binding protein